MTDNNTGERELEEYRCMNCGRLLFRALLVEGVIIQIHCPKCSSRLSIAHNDNGMHQFVNYEGHEDLTTRF